MKLFCEIILELFFEINKIYIFCSNVTSKITENFKICSNNDPQSKT